MMSSRKSVVTTRALAVVAIGTSLSFSVDYTKTPTLFQLPTLPRRLVPFSPEAPFGNTQYTFRQNSVEEIELPDQRENFDLTVATSGSRSQ